MSSVVGGAKGYTAPRQALTHGTPHIHGQPNSSTSTPRLSKDVLERQAAEDKARRLAAAAAMTASIPTLASREVPTRRTSTSSTASKGTGGISATASGRASGQSKASAKAPAVPSKPQGYRDVMAMAKQISLDQSKQLAALVNGVTATATGSTSKPSMVPSASSAASKQHASLFIKRKNSPEASSARHTSLPGRGGNPALGSGVAELGRRPGQVPSRPMPPTRPSLGASMFMGKGKSVSTSINPKRGSKLPRDLVMVNTVRRDIPNIEDVQEDLKRKRDSSAIPTGTFSSSSSRELDKRAVEARRAQIARERSTAAAPLPIALPPVRFKESYSDRSPKAVLIGADRAKSAVPNPAKSAPTKASLLNPYAVDPREEVLDDAYLKRNISAVIGSIFKRSASRTYDDEDDLDDMEAGYADVLREESKSSRIARREEELEAERERQDVLRKKQRSR
jgi:hypothetical protein